MRHSSEGLREEASQPQGSPALALVESAADGQPDSTVVIGGTRRVPESETTRKTNGSSGRKPYRAPAVRTFDRSAAFDAKTKRAESGCLEWTGALMSRGYGSFGLGDGKTVLAHRYAYERAKGPIPDGLTIDHVCFNKRCVEPRHLEAVTGKVNSRRYADTITHCKSGHPLSGDNLFHKKGKRQCRECARAQQRKAYAKAKAKRGAA